MKGWVYVASMSNTVGVLKIGHTTRDPDERVQELASDTGAPGVGRVEYAALVEDPEKVERAVHRHLSRCRDKGEWFKCDVPATVIAIRQCGEILYEDDRAHKRAEADLREAKERARREREQREAAKREAEELARIEEERRREAEQREAYEQKLAEWKKQNIEPKSVRYRILVVICIIVGGIALGIVIAVLSDRLGSATSLIIFLVVSALGIWSVTRGHREIEATRPKPEDFGLDRSELKR